MSAARVLGAVAELRHCPHTGLTIPECCCRHCCEALLRRYAPQLVSSASTASRHLRSLRGKQLAQPPPSR